jgi:SAM-dependent methyltransferase
MTGGGEGVARFFDAIAGRYERAYAMPTAESRRRMERVVRSLPAPPGRVLVLGVGTGRELPALLDAGYEPTGLDASREMLARCARRARPIPLAEGDFYKPPLPFAAGQFDAAVALHGTLSHPPSLQAMEDLAGELARVVRRGGKMLAEVPSTGWLDRLETAPALAAHADAGDDRRVRRTGERTCVHEDLVTGASIEALLLDAPEWRSAFERGFRVSVEAAGEVEWFVVADRV